MRRLSKLHPNHLTVISLKESKSLGPDVETGRQGGGSEEAPKADALAFCTQTPMTAVLRKERAACVTSF